MNTTNEFKLLHTFTLKHLHGISGEEIFFQVREAVEINRKTLKYKLKKVTFMNIDSFYNDNYKLIEVCVYGEENEE